MPSSPVKLPLLKLNRLVGHSGAKNHMSPLRLGNTRALEEESAAREAESAKQQHLANQKKRQEKEALRRRRAEYEVVAHESDPPTIRWRYGTRLPEADTEVDAEPADEDKASQQEDEARYSDIRLDQLVLVDGATAAQPGMAVQFVARMHHCRAVSARLAFVVFRQQLDTLQGVLACRDGVVSENFVRWAEHLRSETLVRVAGVLQAPAEPVRSCSVHAVELRIDRMHVLVPVVEGPPVDPFAIDLVEPVQADNDKPNKPAEDKPADVDKADKAATAVTAVTAAPEDAVAVPDPKNVVYVHPQHTRTANRLSYLRTPTMQAIMRIKATICELFRSTLTDEGFLEVHSPRLQPVATESGAAVFRVRYFDRTAFLAQSPQLSKQLCMSADLGRVFEIGSVFRAENSNTHRHLTEFVSMDLEMVLEKSYYEAMNVIDHLLKTIIRGVYARRRHEVDVVKTHFPSEDVVIPDETVVLHFREAVRLLNDSGWRDEGGNPASPLEDLSTPAEVRLGQLVKERYHTDYYILDKFPRAARPFYAHLDATDPQYTNSFDIFLRGQEITTGGQRIHDVRTLKRRMREANIDPADMEEYVQGFEWGVLPHAGCGIGLERVLFLLLNLQDVRNATLFPRDPKSLPAKPPVAVQAQLAHPEADTIEYAIAYDQYLDGASRSSGEAGSGRTSSGGRVSGDFTGFLSRFSRDSGRHSGSGDSAATSATLASQPPPPLPPIEKLIANYGDATNTSWLDDRFKVWRHASTGAAVGYAEENGYALVVGDPLCDPRQYALVIAAFLRDLRKNLELRPLWLLVSGAVEELLGTKLGWNTMTCVAEERVDVAEAQRAARAVKKKERQAQEAGVTVHVLDKGQPVPEELREKCEERIAAWKAARAGKRQVHLTEVRPWVDLAHRRFVWAEDRTGQVAALVVLHDLAPAHGCQIKFALDFPGAPGGTIELAIARALEHLAGAGIQKVTFGAGATRTMEFGPRLQGTMRARVLAQTYRTIAEQLQLWQKTEFREKFGAVEERVYICYPHMGLGVSGVRTLIRFFEDEM